MTNFGGYEPNPEPAARRSLFDVRRIVRDLTTRVSALEADDAIVTSMDWQSFTPVYGNFNIGASPGNVGHWRWMNPERTSAEVIWGTTLGTGFSWSAGSQYIDLPSAMTVDRTGSIPGLNSLNSFGQMQFVEAGVGSVQGHTYGTGGSDRIFFYYHRNVSGTVTGTWATPTATGPFTWAANDQIFGHHFIPLQAT